VNQIGIPETTFEALRRRLFGLAYRMLGSRADAEDIVQDAYVRWHQVEHEGRRTALLIDGLLGQQQVVIKSIEESYGAVPGIAAATILGNGRVAFILDVEKLSDLAVHGCRSRS